METSRQSQENTLLKHEGEITLADSERMFALMYELVTAGQVPRSAFRAFVELVQNIRIHGGAKGAVKVWVEQDAVMVQAVNEAPQEAVATVHNIIYFINENAEDIISIMRELRNAQIEPDAKGAGLGLMELRRLSGHDLLISDAGADLNKSVLVITVRLDHKSNP